MRRVLLPLLAAAVLVAGCSGDDPPAVEAATVEPIEANVLTGRLQVTLDEPARIRVDAVADGHEVTDLPWTAEEATEHTYPVIGLRAETTYDLQVRVDGDDDVAESVEFTTGALPEHFPEVEVNVADQERMSPGYTMLDVRANGEPDDFETYEAIQILDDEGEVVWYWYPENEDDNVGDARMTDDGTILVQTGLFSITEIDVFGEVVNRWVLGEGDEESIGVASEEVDLTSFHHEVVPLDNGNLLALARHNIPTTAEQRAQLCPDENDPEVEWGIEDDVIVEFQRDGTIVNEWNLADIVDPFTTPSAQMCVEPDSDDYATNRDWSHGNAVVLDEERNAVLVSARHIDQVVAFRYEDDDDGPAGELLWTLGVGGTLDIDGEPVRHQHAPEVQEDGSILLFDNGNFREPVEYSRAVQFDIDDEAGTAETVWEFRTTHDDGPLYAAFLGDADRLENGNVLVGAGGIRLDGVPRTGRILEVVPDGDEGGDVVLDLRLPDHHISYRSERLPSLLAGPDWTDDA